MSRDKILFYNGLILTMEPGTGFQESLLVENGFIKDIGEYHKINDYTDGKTLKIDLNKKILLPGLIDNHTHFFKYLKDESSVNLQQARSLKDVATLIKEKVEILQKDSVTNPESLWIFCSNLEKHRIRDYPQLDVKFLDSITAEMPILITSKDHHTKCCNSAALKIAGIDRQTPDPPGGKIGRFQDGTPNGFLYEKAWILIDRVLKQNEETDYFKLILPTVLCKLHRLGLTGIHTMENYADYLNYKDLFEQNLRVCWHIYDEDIEKVINNNHRSYSGDEFSKFGTIKTFLDGSLGSSSALLSKYDHETEENFSLLLGKDEIRDLLFKCRENNLGLSFHSIGDKSTKILLDIIEQIYPDEKKISPLIRLEHLQFLNEHDIARIKKRGLYCSMQPYHISFDIPIIESSHPSLRDIAYPLSLFFDYGCDLGFGSDSPVADINPFAGIYSAITRKSDLDPQNESWTPQYCLTPTQALYGYTSGASIGSQSRSSLGTLKPGKIADMIVIDDYRQQPPEFWLQAHSYLTMINGRIVYNELPH